MDETTYTFLCHSLAKATSTSVRLYCGTRCHYYYSAYHLSPDPVSPFLPQLLVEHQQAGVITTPLYQFYGFFALGENWRIIIGPTRIENNEARVL